MRTYFVAFTLALVASLFLTRLVRDLALRWGWVDEAVGGRKVHTRAVPRVGGVAIAVSFFLPVAGLFFWDNRISEAYLSDIGHVTGLALGAVVVVGLGLLDDLKDLRARTKFIVQIATAVMAFGFGYQISAVANPFGDPVVLGLFALPVTVLWIVGVMNAINLIDGLDGLATGISLFTVVILFAIGLVNEREVVALTAAALAGSLVGFLRYNFNPASVFMGDSGSLFLGYVLAVTSISGATKSSTVVSLVIPTLALGLPVMDTTLSVLRRALGGRPIFSADRGHLHHRFLDSGLSHRQTVLAMYLVCLVFGLAALGLIYANSVQAAMILGGVGAAAIGLTHSLGYLRWNVLAEGVRYGLLRQQALRSNLGRLETAGAAIRAADSELDAIEQLLGVGQAVGADLVLVRGVLHSPSGTEPLRGEWRKRESSPGYILRHELVGRHEGRELDAVVEFGWHCEGEQLQLPEALAYDWLCMVLRERLLGREPHPHAESLAHIG